MVFFCFGLFDILNCILRFMFKWLNLFCNLVTLLLLLFYFYVVFFSTGKLSFHCLSKSLIYQLEVMFWFFITRDLTLTCQVE